MLGLTTSLRHRLQCVSILRKSSGRLSAESGQHPCPALLRPGTLKANSASASRRCRSVVCPASSRSNAMRSPLPLAPRPPRCALRAMVASEGGLLAIRQFEKSAAIKC